MTRSKAAGLAVVAALIAIMAAVGVRSGWAQSGRSVRLIVYGDTRFTDPSNVKAANARARTALVARIATERPDAVLITGDLVWHGGTATDYDQYRRETASWRAARLRIIPALGNHEFSRCQPEACLATWWSVFPALKGERWYATDVTARVRVVALDTMSPLTTGSPQRAWLERELGALPASVQFVVVILHHPPVADIQTRVHVDHNPRPNEIALREYLGDAARARPARFVVIAGHIHNYERFLQDGIVYLVSGGGGGNPYEVDRTPADLYQGIDFPNYHYLRMTIDGHALKGEMYRLDEPAAPTPHFTLKDTFEVDAPPRR
jgi:3',5'-cyclic AMP phosphodiesterase CpdA